MRVSMRVGIAIAERWLRRFFFPTHDQIKSLGMVRVGRGYWLNAFPVLCLAMFTPNRSIKGSERIDLLGRQCPSPCRFAPSPAWGLRGRRSTPRRRRALVASTPPATHATSGASNQSRHPAHPTARPDQIDRRPQLSDSGWGRLSVVEPLKTGVGAQIKTSPRAARDEGGPAHLKHSAWERGPGRAVLSLGPMRAFGTQFRTPPFGPAQALDRHLGLVLGHRTLLPWIRIEQ